MLDQGSRQRARGRARPAAQFPQHQRPGARASLGSRPFQDRLHQRSRPLPGHAGPTGVEGSDRGTPRFVGTAITNRRRQPHQEVGGDPRERRSLELGGRRFVGGAQFSDLAAVNFRKDVLEGLARPQKALPPKYFYDAAGSRLFEQICRLREYYPTRTELGITRRHLNDIARFAGKRCALLEYGSGESLKTRLLIRALQPSVYMPVDISTDALRGAVKRLRREFPRLGIVAITADFSHPLSIPAYRGKARRVVYFPGSTIGNLRRDEAQAFLRMTRGQVGANGAMLVGVDLKTDPTALHAAYNDAKGVTAAFNLNLLARINRELGGDMDVRRFAHYAFYN